MPRGRKKRTAAATAEPAIESLPEAVVTNEVEQAATVPSEPSGIEPKFDAKASESIAEAIRSPARGQFRSWIVDSELGYTRMTDEKNRLLVIQFADKPNSDVLSAVKGAGFQFQPDHFGQKNAWVRQNDFEGRLQVESIESLFRSVSTRREPARH